MVGTARLRLGHRPVKPPHVVQRAAAPAAQLPRTSLEDKSPESQARAEVTRRIKELGRKGKPKQAINELTALAKMGIQPDTISATALVSACVANRNMEMAMNVFDELFVDFVKPDDVVFAILIRGLGQVSNPPDWAEVAKLLTRMRSDFDVPMSTPVYNSLLQLCAASNDLARAEELIDKMTLEGLRPDQYTRSVLEGKRSMRAALKRAFS